MKLNEAGCGNADLSPGRAEQVVCEGRRGAVVRHNVDQIRTGWIERKECVIEAEVRALVQSQERIRDRGGIFLHFFYLRPQIAGSVTVHLRLVLVDAEQLDNALLKGVVLYQGQGRLQQPRHQADKTE